MQHFKRYPGVRHRILLLMYIAGLTISLSPAMVAPPEKTFNQGQPEMHQSMDNMVNHKPIIQKRMNGDKTDPEDMLKAKTSNLLAEAEEVLNSLPNSKDRQWIEMFVKRMKNAETMLEKTAKNENSPKTFNSMSGTPVPEGHSPQSAWPTTPAVPAINPFQKPIKMMSKPSETSPELSKVLLENAYPKDQQVVTKPAVLPNKEDESESDELVRELESLHSLNEADQSTKIPDEDSLSTTPSPPSSPSESYAEVTTISEANKERLKLFAQISEFQRQGIIFPREVINALHAESTKAPVEAVTDRNQNVNMEDKIKFTEAGMVDRRGIQRRDYANNEEEKYPKAILQSTPYQPQQQQPEKFNYTFQYGRPDLMHVFARHTGNFFHPFPFQNRGQPYVDRRSFAQGLQKPYLFNQGKYNNVIPPNQKLGYIPGPFQQMPKMDSFYNGPLAAPDYNNYYMKHSYNPYPYMHSWNPKNSSLQLPPMMSPYLIKPSDKNKIDTQLSEEMKRELRDGKIIVLSDSVLRSNFEPNNNEKGEEKPAVEIMNNQKNQTQTEN